MSAVKSRGIKITGTGQQFLDYNHSWAILIGINNYRHWPDLNYAVNEVNAVKKMLIENYGFPETNIKVCLNENASLNNIRALLEGDFITQIKENDRLLFFWAGHGETRILVGGRESGYLIPYDGTERGTRDAYATYLSMDEISRFSDRCAAKHILYLVDACYSGFAAAARGALEMPENLRNYYLKLTQEQGRQIITAGRKGESVIESHKWGHSAFTFELLHALSQPFFAADQDVDGLITTTDLASYLKREVPKLTEGSQTPVFATLGGEGEFVFIRPDLEDLINVPSVPPEPPMLPPSLLSPLILLSFKEESS